MMNEVIDNYINNDSNFPKIWGSKKYLHFDSSYGASSSRKLVSKIYKNGIDEKYVKHFCHYPLIVQYKKQIKYKSGKKKIKHRKISLVSHRDSILLKVYCELLTPNYECFLKGHNLENEVVAYRKKHSNIDTAKEVFDFIKKSSVENRNNIYVIKGDFKDYFNNLDHNAIKINLMKVLDVKRLTDDWYSVYKFITKSAYVNHSELPKKGIKYSYCKCAKEFPKFISENNIVIHRSSKRKGIPQGTPISGIIANIYAFDMDRELKKIAEKYNGIYRRYSDDFILVFNDDLDNEDIEDIYLNKMGRIVDDAKQKLEHTKTKIYEFKNGVICGQYHLNNDKKLVSDKTTKPKLTYLGFDFDGNKVLLRNGTLSRFKIKSDKNISKMYKNMKNNELNYFHNIKGRHLVVQRYLTIAKPKPFSNTYSYACRAQNKMSIFENEKYIYEVKIKEQIKKMIHRNQMNLNNLKNIEF